MNQNCNISVITICYNEEQTIGKTIQSVLSQDVNDFEYIIIDGASCDNTINIVNQYSDNRIHLYSEPDMGISDAFNKGIAKSSGTYLYFLNSGDYLVSSDSLRKVSETLYNNDDIVTYSVESMYWGKFPKDESEGRTLWIKSMIPHQGTFIKKNVFDKVGFFNENFKVRMDYEFFCRCYKEKCTFKCVPEIIAHYDMDGISSNNRYLFEKEGMAIRLIYGNDIDESDVKLMQRLYWKNGDEHNHIRLNLQKDVCVDNVERKNSFWNYKHYIIYGAGAAGYRLYNVLKKEIPISDISICDTYKYGEFLDEFAQRVVALQNVIDSFVDAAIIISIQNRSVLCDVYNKLIRVGISSDAIYIYDEDEIRIL